MHQFSMLPIAKLGVHIAPREGGVQVRLTSLHAIQNVFQIIQGEVLQCLARVVTVQQILAKGCQSLKVLPSFIAIGLVPPRQIALRPTSIFRRTRTRAASANGIGLLGTRIQYGFDTDLVFPIVPHVVDAGKPVIPAKPEAAQWNIRTRGMQFPRSIVDGANIKLKQVNAVPPHRGLKDPVQLT